MSGAFRVGLLAATLFASSLFASRDRSEILSNIVARAEQSHSTAFALMQDGQVLARFPENAGRLEAYSMTKSFVSLAVGLLIQEGKLSLDEPLSKYFPEWNQGHKKQITLRHLLNHTSGLDTAFAFSDVANPAGCVQLALCSDSLSAPGTSFAYNNKAVNLLGHIVEKAAGQPIDIFLQERLFAPMGINDVKWTRDAKGTVFSAAGLQISLDSLLKVGQLLLDNGAWNGEQLVSADWIAQCQEAYPITLRADKNVACSHLFWVSEEGPHLYAATGMLGQYLIIVPEQRIVCVRQLKSEERNPAIGKYDTFAELPFLVAEFASPEDPFFAKVDRSQITSTQGV